MPLKRIVSQKILYCSMIFFLFCFATQAHAVRLKNLARIEGIRANMISGYGIVIGLAGSGDSGRSIATQQSIANTLESFGVSINYDDISTRNSAAVIISAEIPPFATPGNRIDAVVSSLGDARSLVGGTLLMAPLQAANGKIYALAQGQVTVGGFKFDLNGNLVQKNHPTVGLVSNGAILEKDVPVSLMSASREINIVLNEADFTTADRLVNQLNNHFGGGVAVAQHAGKIKLIVPDEEPNVVRFIAKVENLEVTPDSRARIVVNERTGTIVSGGDVVVSEVSLSHGNIKLTITTDYEVSQPSLIATRGNSGVESIVVPNTEIEVEESVVASVNLPNNTTIADLVSALRQIKTSTRDVITILQAIKAAGALHAELVIQ